MKRHLRYLFALLVTGCCCSKAIAEHVTYAFGSVDTGLYGEITFDNTNENFTAGGTATYWNGAVVNYWFQRGDAYWDFADLLLGGNSDDGLFFQFNANGAGPDDIASYGYDAFDFAFPGGTVQQLSFVQDFATNGNHEFFVWSIDIVTPSSELLAQGTDGVFSLAAPAQDSVELHSVIIEESGDVSVKYSKDFIACADLYRESPLEITHSSDFFCLPGEHVVCTYSGSEFFSLTAGESVFLKQGNDGTRSASVTVTNRPVADAGVDQVISCPGGTLVQLDGTGSYDPNGDAFTMEWVAPTGVILDDPTSATPIGAFPMGITMATLIVTDEHGAIQTDDVVITVYDDAPPEVACTTDITSLAPANHEMVAIEVYINATDACDAPDKLRLDLVTLESSEPDDARGKGDGSTTGDTHGTDGYASPVNVTNEFVYNSETKRFEGIVFLRAELDKDGPGRAYSINATVIDTTGNHTDTSCVVVVPMEDNTGGKTGNKGGKGSKK